MLYAITILVGFLPFVISITRMKRMQRLRRKGITTNATLKEIYGRSLRGMNRVLVEFTLESGQLFSKEIIVGGVPYNVGDQLPLL